MKNRKSIYILLLFLALSIKHYGQSDVLNKANSAFLKADYPQALTLFKNYSQIESDPQALERRGISFLYMNFLHNAERDFTKSRQLGNDNPDLLWYMGQYHHHLFQYELAARFYRQYALRTGETGQFYNKALLEIKNCLYAATEQIHESETESLVQGFGALNTSYDELHPVQSRQFGNRFYFSSNRNKIDFKIYAFDLADEGSWDSVDTSSEKYNYGKNNFIQDIDGAGSSMIIVENNTVTQRKKILFTRIAENEELRIPLSEKAFDGAVDFQIVNDSILIFASDQLGGYGGYDLYSSTYSKTTWTVPENLGELVNSTYDERSPCMSSDFSQLFFSSNRPYGYGGYDFYKLDKKLEDKKIINLGAAVNSPGDEMNLRLYDSGHMAVFASNRKSGKGGFDLYFLYRAVESSFSEKDSVSFSYMAIEETNSFIQKEVNNNIDSVELHSHHIITDVPVQAYSILYEDSYDLLNGRNKTLLDYIANRLKNDDLQLTLMAYTDKFEPGLPEYVQYNCLKRAIVVVDYLTANGVKPEKFRIESMGSGFPIVKHESSGKVLDSLSEFNKRIDLLLSKGDLDSALEQNLAENLDIPKYARESEFELFQLVRDGLYYSVRIAHADRIFKNAVLRLYNDIYIRKESPSSENDYYIGIYTKLEDAQVLTNDLSKLPGLDPEIFAFYKGRKLEKEDLEKMKISLPQLENLID